MITNIEILGTEELLLERNPRAAAVHEAIMATGREAVIALNERFDDPSDDAAMKRFDAELETIVERSISEYVRQARGLFSAEDVALWTAKITRVPGSYVARAAAVGVPGALFLIEAIEEAESDENSTFVSLDDTLANIAGYCQCGYASSRIVPEQLCRLCSGGVLIAWKTEEDRIVATSPKVRSELRAVFDELLDELATIHLAAGDGSSETPARQRAGNAGITRVNETYAEEIALLDLTRWRELGELNQLSQIKAVNAHRKHWSRWGLGSARLATLAMQSDPEIQARMRRIAGSRPVPKPTLFERLFARR
ncbi:hypothetical protein ITJ57_10030 [Plantibacter sp. VKM Ac-2880]|uniref:hypothetical protein n=1 Tax=Plantibacter sp. VKM Ac-2880 TaxID=2783827 RepID=UPI00189053C7|nr:hypothetical protein [Plantibacter sp. VKM Ac-2880]MBF4569102.1 hypothetical protein [Plantibacter sp. VKM Ac-2880]